MNRKGVIFLVPLLAIAVVTWTAGWIFGQKHVCDQTNGGCSWRTGTASTPEGRSLAAWDDFGKQASAQHAQEEAAWQRLRDTRTYDNIAPAPK